MPIYLGPLIWSTEDGSKSGFSGDQRIGWIHLGIPGTGNGFRLIYLPEVSSDQSLTLVADEARESTTGLIRTRIGNRLGITLDGRTKTMAETIAELLMNHGRGDGSRWRGIRGAPSKRRQAYEIWLGGLGRIWHEDVAPTPSTQVFEETWPTDGSVESGQDQSWTRDTTGLASLTVAGGVVLAGGVDDFDGAVCNSTLDTPNQRHAASFTLVDSDFHVARVCCRFADTNNNYSFDCRRLGGTYGRSIRKRVGGGAGQVIFQENTIDPGASGRMELVVDGATVTARLNGSIVLGPSTDSSPELLTTFHCGVDFYNEVSASGATLDNNLMEDMTGPYSDLSRLNINGGLNTRPYAFGPGHAR